MNNVKEHNNVELNWAKEKGVIIDLPIQLFNIKTISGGAFRLYSYLNFRGGEKRVTWVSWRKVQEDMGLTNRKWINLWTKELSKLGLIIRIRSHPQARNYIVLREIYTDQFGAKKFKISAQSQKFFEAHKMTEDVRDWRKHIIQ